MTPDEADALVRQLVAGDPAAAAAILADASPASQPRERQLTALAAAHLDGDRDRATVLAREHLLEHPDSLLAAWVAGLPCTPRQAGTSPAPEPKELP